MKNKPVAVVVIPTFNEAGTIGKMIDHLFTITFPKIKKWQCKLLIVDGNSPDGTSKLVESKQKEYSNLDLLTETKKEGIGAAYVKGFRRAMSVHHADVVIEMDGDFQHPPKTIPLMLSAIEDGYDYVIGSRKIKGGTNPKGWGFKRLFFSEAGGLVARFVLFFPGKQFFNITDPTTGLKASRVKGFVDTMDMDHLYSRSFAYKLEFLFKMVKLGAKVKEVPLQFGLRTAGDSKITTNTPKDIFRTVILLRWYDDSTQKFIKFGFVGGFGFLINLIGLNVFSRLLSGSIPQVGLRNSIANALASEISIISNFSLNNLWTFKHQKLAFGSKMIKKFVTFNLSSIVGGVIIPTLIVGAGTQFFGDHLRSIFLILAVFGFTLPFNWFVYNHFIWKKHQA